MDEIQKEIRKLREEVEKINKLQKELDNLKAFCSYLAEVHDHIPHLRRVWNQVVAGNFVYNASIEYEDLAKIKAGFMKYMLEFEDRVKDLEDAQKQGGNDKNE